MYPADFEDGSPHGKKYGQPLEAEKQLLLIAKGKSGTQSYRCMENGDLSHTAAWKNGDLRLPTTGKWDLSSTITWN